MVDIIIPTYNTWEVTVGCLKSLVAHGLPPGGRVVVVDDGSTIAGEEYIRPFQWIEFIRREEQGGYPAAINAGLRHLRGSPNPYTVFLNNDCFAVRCWWQELVKCFQRDSHIGLVGPRGTMVAPSQVAMPGQKFERDGVYTCKLIGFCLMVKREALEALGGLDERFGFYMCDDTDYSLRARMAGFNLWLCNTIIMNHLGSLTFNLFFKEPMEKLMERGQALFKEKWGVDVHTATGMTDLSSLDQSLIYYEY